MEAETPVTTQRRGRGCKEERQKEGTERNAKWQALTTAQKIASLKARRGESKRQLNKLAIAWSCELEADHK